MIQSVKSVFELCEMKFYSFYLSNNDLGHFEQIYNFK